jgi:hypothetical protein
VYENLKEPNFELIVKEIAQFKKVLEQEEEKKNDDGLVTEHHAVQKCFD